MMLRMASMGDLSQFGRVCCYVI